MKEETDFLIPLWVYLKNKSKENRTPFDTDISWIIDQYEMGIRNFSGVQIDDEGIIISDENEPFDGYLNGYLDFVKDLKEVENNYNQFLIINRLLRDNEIQTIKN